MNWQAVLKSFRLPFLLLTPICVVLGVASAFHAGLPVDALSVGLAIVAGVLAHIAVNALNEYEDYRSGLDLVTRKTPFSGGSGALPERGEAAPLVGLAGWLALAGTVLIGLYLYWEQGPVLLVMGVVGVLLIVTYTRWINRMPWLCLLAPGTGFGAVMVSGSHYAATGAFSATVLYAAAIPFMLVNNLLLLNQFPDVEADKTVGRRHFPIAYGTKISGYAYGGLLLAAIGLLLVACIEGVFPPICYLLLLPLAGGFYAMRGALRFGTALGDHVQYLAVNVMLTLAVPLLLALMLWLGD